MTSSAPPPIGVDLHLAIDALDLRAAHETHAAVDLHGFGRAEGHGLRRLVLQHGDLGRRAFAVLHAPRQQFQIGLRRVHAHRHVDDLVTDHLLVGEPPAERLALPRPRDRFVDTDLRERRAGGRHAEALGIEVEHDIAKALVLLADQVLDGNLDVVEEQLRRVARPPSHLSQGLLREAGHAPLDQQQRHAARARDRRCARRPCRNPRARPT